MLVARDLTPHTSHLTQIAPNLKGADFRVEQRIESEAWKNYTTQAVARIHLTDVMVGRRLCTGVTCDV